MTYREQIEKAEQRIAAEMKAAGLDPSSARMFAEREVASKAEAQVERRHERRVS